MKINYLLVVAIVSAVYLGLKQWLPDVPVSDTVFQVVILWLLARLGVEVVDKPAESLRKAFRK